MYFQVIETVPVYSVPFMPPCMDHAGSIAAEFVFAGNIMGP